MATVAPEASQERAFNPCDRVYQVSQEFKPDKSKTWPYPAEEDGWFHAHNALRRELQMLEDCFEAVAARSMKTALLLEWEVECIKTIFEGHYEFIHEHHSNEDTKFTPVFSKRFRYPDKLTDDHEEIVKQLEAVCSRVRALQAGDNREVVIGSLTVDFKVYRTNLTAHLKEEEDTGIPLMRAYFDPKSIGKIVEEVMKSAPKVSKEYHVGRDTNVNVKPRRESHH